MELDFEPKTLLITFVMYVFIFCLIWFVPYGFSGLGQRISFSLVALPLTYLMVNWQLNK